MFELETPKNGQKSKNPFLRGNTGALFWGLGLDSAETCSRGFWGAKNPMLKVILADVNRNMVFGPRVWARFGRSGPDLAQIRRKNPVPGVERG